MIRITKFLSWLMLPPKRFNERSITGSLWSYAFWFIRLRWLAIAGGLIGLALITSTNVTPGVSNPFWFLLDLIVLAAANGIFLQLARQQLSTASKQLITQMIVDLVVTVHLLINTGGLLNPMVMLLFVHVVISGIIFRKRRAFLFSSLVCLIIATLLAVHLRGLLTVDVQTVADHFWLTDHERGLLTGRAGLLIFLVLTLAFFVSTLMSRLREIRSQLVQTARFDTLAGAYDKPFFYDKFETVLDECDPREDSFGVIFIDLDDFKKVNDVHGHNTGDQILSELAGRLKNRLSPGDTLARWGGDEFVILAPVIKNQKELSSKINELFDVVSDSFDIDNNRIILQMSAGMALFPRDGTNPETLISRADIAMYKAKNRSGNSCEHFSPEEDEKIQERDHNQGQSVTALEYEAYRPLDQPAQRGPHPLTSLPHDSQSIV